MAPDRARHRAALLVGAGFFVLLLLVHPALGRRDALWPAVAAIVGGGAAALFLAGRPAGPPRPRAAGLPLAAALGYLGAVSASVAASPAPAAHLEVPAAQMALLAVGWWLGPSRRAWRRLAAVAVAGGAVSGLYCLAQLAGLDPLPRPEDFPDRVLSFFANPNHSGSFAAAVLPLALASFLWPALGPGRRGAVPAGLGWRLAAAVATYAALLLAGSRGAYCASGAGLVALAVGLRADARAGHLALRRGPLLACLVAGLAVTAALYRVPIMSGPAGPVTVAGRVGATAAVLEGGAGDATLAHRLFLWRAAAEMIRQDPWLGAGYGQFSRRLAAVRQELRQHPRYTALTSMQQQELTPYAHNEALHFWAETGLAGLTTFLALVVAGIGALVQALRCPPARAPAWAAGSALTVLLVHGLVSYPLHMALSSYIFWILLGISFSLKEAEPRADYQSEQAV